MQATVKFPPGKKFPSKFEGGKNRINVVLTIDDQDKEITIWGNADNEILTSLTKGEKVQVFKNKDTWIIDESKPQKNEKKGFKKPETSEREKMIDFIDFEAKLYRHCFEQVQEKMNDFALPDTALKDIATTFFIGVCRKFNLQ